jgi:hypothetical protein
VLSKPNCDQPAPSGGILFLAIANANLSLDLNPSIVGAILVIVQACGSIHC